MTFSQQILAENVDQLPPVLIKSDAPLLELKLNPKSDKYSQSAQDGAAFLTNMSGFSVIRKGGKSADPVFRGFAGSRLGILVDGEEMFGGCGGRMDPPTAYISPYNFDEVQIIKGPQTVLYGPGHTAGTIIFNHHFSRPETTQIKGQASALFGSANRHDFAANASFASPVATLNVGATKTHANDYKDAHHQRIHSRYTHWDSQAQLYLTPDNTTTIGLFGNLGDGRAAYADRMMDGSRFRKNRYAVSFEKKYISPLISLIETRIYQNKTDHVMDNFSMRSHPVGDQHFNASNPDRTVTGGKLMATLTPTDDLLIMAGTDMRYDRHRARMAMNQSSATDAVNLYRQLPKQTTAQFRQTGIFAETTWTFAATHKWITGLRHDWYQATDRRTSSLAETTTGQTHASRLFSGFMRYEHQYSELGHYYVGLGHAARTPDFWERLHHGTDQSSAFFSTKPEKVNQIDVGLRYKTERFSTFASLFLSDIRDYMLINWNQDTTRNIHARVYGGEIGGRYKITPSWSASAALNYVYGQNSTDHKPLAQQPPAELKTMVYYHTQRYHIGTQYRLVAPQHRIDIGSGNIVSNGKDTGASAGFSVFNLFAGWKPSKRFHLNAGIDNLFNKSYSEHLSKSGQSAGLSNVPLYPLNTQIKEPGRTYWIKMKLLMD